MPTPRAQTFALTPYPGIEGRSVRSIGGQISLTRDGLLVSYVLEGDVERLRVPASATPRFADELWRHTCFELFIARKGQPHYHEFNFSPSGEWAAYGFERYRERVGPDTGVELESINPRVAVRRAAGRLELNAGVPVGFLSPRYAGARLLFGLSAVIEANDGSLSYWALKHPGPKPDFHHPDAFVLEFDEIRN